MRFRLLTLLIVATLSACGDSPLQMAHLSAPESPRLARVQKTHDCEAMPPARRILELERAVAALRVPPARADTRLLPPLATAHRAVNSLDSTAAIVALEEFLRELRALRLHVPLQHVIPLVTTTRCTIGSLQGAR
jgi:hypothetical protein